MKKRTQWLNKHHVSNNEKRKLCLKDSSECSLLHSLRCRSSCAWFGVLSAFLGAERKVMVMVIWKCGLAVFTWAPALCPLITVSTRWRGEGYLYCLVPTCAGKISIVHRTPVLNWPQCTAGRRQSAFRPRSFSHLHENFCSSLLPRSSVEIHVT